MKMFSMAHWADAVFASLAAGLIGFVSSLPVTAAEGGQTSGSSAAFNYPVPPREGKPAYFSIAENGVAKCVIVRPGGKQFPEARRAAELSSSRATRNPKTSSSSCCAGSNSSCPRKRRPGSPPPASSAHEALCSADFLDTCLENEPLTNQKAANPRSRARTNAVRKGAGEWWHNILIASNLQPQYIVVFVLVLF